MFNQVVAGGVTESSAMLMYVKSYLQVGQFTWASIKCCYSRSGVKRGYDLFEVTH